MYTMLIVDDERLLLDGLFQLFSEQQDLHLSLHKASSGIEALKIIEERKIDILLTDIKMPKMSGLELGGHVSRIWPGCEIIYLTGFNEFEYVHHAIKNGALNYILKTEGDDHIVASVRQAVRELEEKQQAASLLEEAEELRKRQLLHYRSQYLTDYIEGIVSPDEITQAALVEYGIQLDRSRDFLLVAGRADGSFNAQPPNRRELHWTALRTLCERRLSPLLSIADVVYNRTYCFLLLQPLQEEVPWGRTITYVNAMLEQIQQTARQSMGTAFSFAVMSRSSSWERVSHHVLLLKLLLAQYQSEQQIIITERHLSEETTAETVTGFSANMDIFLKKAALLDMYLETGRKQETESVLIDLRKLLLAEEADDWVCLEMLQFVSLRFLSVINKFKLHQVPFFSRHLEKFLYPPLAGDRLVMIDLYSEAALVLYEVYREQSLRVRVDVVSKLKAYIAEHVSGDLSLTNLAEQVYLNPDYMSRLFKQAEGVTVSEYIVAHKLQQAKALLSEPDLLIQDIAARLGFTTAGYFSRFFKKETGLTPQEYRNQ